MITKEISREQKRKLVQAWVEQEIDFTDVTTVRYTMYKILLELLAEEKTDG